MMFSSSFFTHLINDTNELIVFALFHFIELYDFIVNNEYCSLHYRRIKLLELYFERFDLFSVW